MAEGIELVLAFHNHQPVGNFENIFREAFEKCYDPFLKFLEEHPRFRVTLHYSGCLFDWLEAREKQFLKRLERLIRKNQLEMLSGGYYEPILPSIPERDAVRQIHRMNRYLKQRFGKTPGGFWLTERVWEPKLPRIAAEAGVSYTAIDETHFALAGFSEKEISDFFLTEEEGFPLYVFPAAQFLRYAIPFRDPYDTLDYLKGRGPGESGARIVTYADDGEKFGLWPGTYQWVYREGWLERFAKALEENASWIFLKTFGEILEERKGLPVKKAYLPTASYEEMMEWALSRDKAVEFRTLKQELESNGLWNRARHFFQGGTFKNFYTKYSEADWMRSRMRSVSREVQGVKKRTVQERAEHELWQGQCNCPYWHGVFGGLYLHHLRRSTYEHLIRAEQMVRPQGKLKAPTLSEEDLNQDGVEEILIRTPVFSFFFLPHRGGSLAELDFLPVTTNVLDTLTRRKESYHNELVRSGEASRGSGKSIHEMEKTVSPEVLERVAFDPYERYSLLEHFLPSEIGFDEFWKAKFGRRGEDPTRTVYAKSWVAKRDGDATLVLKGKLSLGPEMKAMIEKKITIRSNESAFTVSWKITNTASKRIEGLWGSEWSMNFYGPPRKESGVHKIELQDGWSPVHLEISSTQPFDYWQFPIETLSQTEKDFRLIHQGMALFPHWRISLQPQEVFGRKLVLRFSA